MAEVWHVRCRAVGCIGLPALGPHLGAAGGVADERRDRIRERTGVPGGHQQAVAAMAHLSMPKNGCFPGRSPPRPDCAGGDRHPRRPLRQAGSTARPSGEISASSGPRPTAPGGRGRSGVTTRRGQPRPDCSYGYWRSCAILLIFNIQPERRPSHAAHDNDDGFASAARSATSSRPTSARTGPTKTSASTFAISFGATRSARNGRLSTASRLNWHAPSQCPMPRTNRSRLRMSSRGTRQNA